MDQDGWDGQGDQDNQGDPEDKGDHSVALVTDQGVTIFMGIKYFSSRVHRPDGPYIL